MKSLIVILASILFISCSPSPMAIVASQACECIDRNPYKTETKCVEESIIKNKSILENSNNQKPILDKDGNVNYYYHQLIYMTMLQTKCQ